VGEKSVTAEIYLYPLSSLAIYTYSCTHPSRKFKEDNYTNQLVKKKTYFVNNSYIWD